MSAMQTMSVEVPAGAAGGSPLQVQTPSGPMVVVIPDGLKPGDAFTIQVPSVAIPTAVAVAPLEPVQCTPVAAQPAVASGVPVSVGGGGTNFERLPVHHTCQYCGVHDVTRVRFQTGLGTWLMCGGSCLFGCWLGCCLVPFCVDQMKDAKHYCPSCGRCVGIKALADTGTNSSGRPAPAPATNTGTAARRG